MVRKFLIVICTLLPALLDAQNITIHGKIVSAETGDPVPFANIFLPDPHSNLIFGTISDTEGSFTLSIPTTLQSDTLQISFVGFESQKIPVAAFQRQAMMTIKLHTSVTYLSSVIVRDLSAEEFFMKCVSGIHKNYLDATFINRCFYWQSEQEDGTYQSLKHAYLSVEEVIDQEKLKRTLTKDSAFQMGKIDELHFLEDVGNIFYFDFLRAGTSFLKKEYLKEWTFTYNTTLSLPENYVMIDAVRLDKFTRLKLLINDNDYAIEQVDYSYKLKDVDQPLNDSLHYKMGELKGKVIYRKNTAHYNLKYITNDFSYVIFEKLTYKKLFTRHVHNEIVTFTSQELKPGDKPRSGNVTQPPLPREFVVVDKAAYDEAAKNLSHHSNSQPLK